MNELFSGKSIAEMGTLCQLKNYFGHRNVLTDVMNCFNYADNFIRFVTEAHVAYLAVDVLGMKDIDDIPEDALPDGEDKNSYIMSISKKIVNAVWSCVTPSAVLSVIEADTGSQKWCFCGKGVYVLYLHT